METKIERTYWGDGQLRSELLYVNEVRHGLSKWRYQSGELGSEVPYVDGVVHGMAKYWRRNGDISGFWLYNQDELVAKFNPKNKTQRWKLK
jgi:antitoxin component YwqK of YwqJK toxin-antitoxin module